MLKKLLLKQSDKLIAINTQIVGNYFNLGVSENKIVCIPNGVDINRFAPSADKQGLRNKLGLPLDKIVFIFSGRLVKQKGLDTLIEAFAKLETKFGNVFLLVVGGVNPDISVGSSKKVGADLNKKAWASTIEEAYQKATAAGVTTVKFTGFVDDVAPYLAASDVFVFPSLTEGMSNALLEAMASGLAVVASDIPANVSVIQHGETGLLFEAKKAAALLECLEELTVNPDLLSKLAINARKEVVSKYNLQIVLEQYLQVIEAL